MFGHAMAGAMLAVAVAGSSVAVVVSSQDATRGSPAAGRASAVVPVPVARTSRPSAGDWEKIKQAARLRRMALEPRRTSAYRSFAAYMGLSGLKELHPLHQGRCTVAVSYLYDNLLDLRQAVPAEDWRALRRYIAGEPPLSSCAPRPARFHVLVPYEA